jgi:integrase
VERITVESPRPSEWLRCDASGSRRYHRLNNAGMRHRDVPVAATLALTGLRYGEATALKWTDLDADAGIIRVRRAQWHGVVSTTKTGVSRTVPLVGELADVLRNHRARLLPRQVDGLGDGWVFPGQRVGLLRPNALGSPLRRALKGCGITKRVSVHGLRRTFNNLARQVAGDIVTRSITGHVTASMTEHYSHVDAREKLAAASKALLLLAPAGQVGDQVGDPTDSAVGGGLPSP